MNCQQAQASLSLYLYGELDFAQEESLETHLAECAACQLSLAREKEWHTAANAQFAEPSLDLLSECRKQLRPTIARETAPRQTVRGWWRWGNPIDLSTTPWSRQLALASLLVFIGFFTARWLDHGSPLSGLSAVNQMSLLNPANVLVRDIETGNGGLVKIVLDQESEVSGKLGDPNVRRLLVSAARQSDAATRFYSMQLLNQDAHAAQADDIRQVFFDAVRSDPNPACRLQAIDGIRRITGDPAALAALKFALEHDDNAGVRYQIIDILVPPDGNMPITPATTQMIQDVLRSAPQDDYVHARCSQILEEAKLPVVY